MKTNRFLSLVATLSLCAAATAQLHVQPVTGIHTIVIEDHVRLKVYSGEKTQIEVLTSEPVANVRNGIMTIDENAEATLCLAPGDGLTHFQVKDGASLTFTSAMDFGKNQFTIDAEDNATVEFVQLPTGNLKANYVIFNASDNARIVSKMPLAVAAYSFRASDNAYVEMPSIEDIVSPSDSTLDKAHYITIEDNGKIVIRDRGEKGVYSARDGKVNIHLGGKRNGRPSRDSELSWFWGFNNWGDSPFGGFGGVDGDAEVNFYFMNYGLSFDYPFVNTPHFGLYAGLGLEGNTYHFSNNLVSYNPAGYFQATSTGLVTTTTGTLDPNNWDTYLQTIAITVPITFSFEPWKYDDFCIRLSAIPGINIYGALAQQYESKAIDLNITDHETGKKVSNFMLDARLTLLYGNFGLYAQVATVPIMKDGLYPVKFGFFLNLFGR